MCVYYTTAVYVKQNICMLCLTADAMYCIIVIY